MSQHQHRAIAKLLSARMSSTHRLDTHRLSSPDEWKDNTVLYNRLRLLLLARVKTFENLTEGRSRDPLVEHLAPIIRWLSHREMRVGSHAVCKAQCECRDVRFVGF